MYVRQGEKLYLSPEMDALAKDEQREAMESDEREGLVREYLDTLLPERWAEMDLFERRNFLTGSDFGGLQEKGTVKRTNVSNMEIWCECFGKERANLRRTDSNELTGILARLGWKREESKVRIPSMGRSTSLFRRGVPNEDIIDIRIAGNKFPGAAPHFGTPAGTPHGNGGSPISGKENRLPCSCVPNISYISKDVRNRGHQHAKHAYTRIRGFFGSRNTGGRYAGESH